MNVNPFSYLMNKISQKVSKSGDRMTGELEFYNLGDSIHINRVGNATYSGWLKFSNANGLCGMYGAHNNKKPYFYDGNDFTQIALAKSNDALYGANPGTTVSSETFANGHTASEYKFIAIEMYWGGLTHSLDVKVIPSQAWIGTDAFKLVNANGNVTLTVSNRTNTGFDIVANNGAVAVAIEGIY